MAVREIKSKKNTATGELFSYCPLPGNEKATWTPDKCIGCEHFESHEERSASYKIHCNFPAIELKQFEPPKAVDKLVYRVEGQPNQSLDRTNIHLADSHQWMEKKLDGVRALIHCTPDGVFITSRRKDKFGLYGMMGDNFPQITQDPQLIALGEQGYTIFDSEVMMPVDTETLKETMSIVGASSGKAIARQRTRGWAVFHIFDMSWIRGEDLTENPLWSRSDHLHTTLYHIDNEYMVQVQHWLAETSKVRLGLAGNFIDQGYEGAIAKDRYSKYHEKRAWLKYKQSVTFEAQITGFEYGAVGGKWEHGVGALVASVYNTNGQLVQVCTFNPGDDDVRMEWLGTLQGMDKADILEAQFIVELQGQSWTADFSVRHPRVIKYRPDKNEPDTIDLSEQVVT